MADNVSTTTYTADVPAMLQPYVGSMLENASNLTNPNVNPYAGLGSYYQATGQTPFAQFNPLQTQAAAGSASLGPSAYLGQSAGIMSDVANQASRYGQIGNLYNAPQAQSMGFNYQSVNAPSLQNYQMAGPQQVSGYQYGPLSMASAERVAAPNLQQYQMGPAERIQADRFGAGQAAEYMSPYMQNVVDTQKREAIKDYARNLPQLGAQAAKAGGYGGTRSALLQSEAQRNLQNQLQGIQATGTQQAFQNAQQQFAADRAAQLQAAQANQQAGLTVGQQNLSAGLQTQQLGAQTGIQAALANQQAGLTTGQQNLAAEQARQQFMGQQGLAAQQANQQAGLTAGQANLNALLGIQSLGAQQGLQAQQSNQSAYQQMQQMQANQLQNLNQYGLTNAANQAQYGLAGANLGLQGLQQQLAAGQQLGNLGQNQFNQQLAAIQQQQALGQSIYGTESDVAKARFADYQAMMNDPLSKLGIYSTLLKNVPLKAGTETSTTPGSSSAGDIAGIGAGLAALYNIFNKG